MGIDDIKKILFSIFLFIIIITTFSKARTISITPLYEGDVILSFGDSLTYGHGAKRKQSYPSILGKDIDYKIINSSKNGETSSKGLKRLKKVLKKYPDIKLLILCEGGNDILRRKSIPKLKSNLKKMIHLAKEKGIDVLLVAVPYKEGYIIDDLPIYKEIAEEEGIPLLSNTLGRILSNKSLKSDRIHPNAKGYNQMAQDIYQKMKKVGWI